MTKWEESCIEAVIAGPIALKLFKERQKNKRHMDQFINKIWPYKRKETKFGKLMKLENVLMTIVEVMDKAKMLEMAYEAEDFKIAFKNEIHKKDKEYILKEIRRACDILTIGELGYIYALPGNYIFEMCMTNEEGEIGEKFTYQGDLKLFLLEWIRGVIAYDSGKISGLFFEFTGGRNGLVEHVNHMKRYIEKIIKVSRRNASKEEEKKERPKKKNTYKGMNVGIEIEFEGIDMQYMEKELKSKYAVSFHSGWDGSTANGNEKGSRLRENRLRINGLRGATALHRLLEEMEEKAILTTNSGMHYHIDCSFGDKIKRRAELRKDLLDDVEIMGSLCSIFEINENIFRRNPNFDSLSEGDKAEEFASFFISYLRTSDEFETIEWRMGTATFNYQKLIIQILTAIHLTHRATRGGNKPIKANIEYLKFLALKMNIINEKM